MCILPDYVAKCLLSYPDHQVQEAWQATIAMAHVASYYPHGNYPKYSYNYPTYCEHTVTM